MSLLDGKDYIFLIWKEPVSRKQYIVGQLSKNGQYEFSYGREVQEAINNGFELLIPFNDVSKVYYSDFLFPVFSSRLPDKKRRDIGSILQKYGLAEYDEYKLLKRGGAKLPIDNLEFIDPILERDKEGFERTFYLAGPRYYIGCNGKDCDYSVTLNTDEELFLELEDTNEHDKNAIRVVKKGSIHIGYIPRYYSEQLSELIRKGVSYDCTIRDVVKNKKCHECIRITLKMPKR